MHSRTGRSKASRSARARRVAGGLASFVVAAAGAVHAAPCEDGPAPSAVPPFAAGQLTDVLERSRVRGSAGVIYVWSPHMPLSQIGLREIAVLTSELDLELVALLDPHADPSSVAAALARCDVAATQIARVASGALVARGLLNHYPSLIVFDSGRLIGEAVLGYRPVPVMRSVLGGWLGRRTAR